MAELKRREVSSAEAHERTRLRAFAMRLNTVEVGEGVDAKRVRPDHINVLLLGGPGTGKSTFINFATSYLTDARLRDGEARLGFQHIAVQGRHKSGGQTTDLEWFDVNDRIRVSDTRGFESLNDQAKKNIVKLANTHENNVSMQQAQSGQLQLDEQRGQGAITRHHAVLFFLSMEGGLGPFDDELHRSVAETLFMLQLNGFRPLIVISKLDLAQSEAQWQQYRQRVCDYMRSWQGPRQGFLFGSRGRLVMEPDDVMTLANVQSSDEWFALHTDSPRSAEFLRRVNALLNVLEKAVDAGNDYIRHHPKFSDTLLAYTVYLGYTLGQKLDGKPAQPARRVAT